MSAFSGSSEARQLLPGSDRGPFSFHCDDLSHHEFVHQSSERDQDENDGCLYRSCCSTFLLCPVTLLFIFFDNLHGQLIPRVLFYWKSVSFSLLDVQLSRMYLFTQPTWLVVRCIFTEFLSHFCVLASQFGLCVSCATVVVDPSSISVSESTYILDNELASMPSTFVLEGPNVDFFVWFVGQYLRTFLNHLFL